MSELEPTRYAELLVEIKQRIHTAQYTALRAVNEQLIGLYWDIGQMIVERQKSNSWGRSIVEQLARDLQAEFPGLGGFSAANLWRMRRFYETYTSNEELAPLVREIGWSQNVIILEKCKDALEREFYLRMSRRMGWTKNVLIHQIENQTYQKTLLNQTNFAQALPEPLRDQARLAVKDEYTFDFLELASASQPTVSLPLYQPNYKDNYLHPNKSQNCSKVCSQQYSLICKAKFSSGIINDRDR
jgi:predicted nuclease of restriction endonuclease-like (RecB) superfamily